MKTTVSDVLKLPSMRGATVLGGKAGLTNQVNYVIVVDFFKREITVDEAFNRIPYIKGELCITSMTDVADDPEAQVRAVRSQYAFGDAGMILYYVGIVVPEVCQELIDVCNELDFPLICMPKNDPSLRYSDAIREIMETVIRSEDQEDYFLPDILRSAFLTPESVQNMQSFMTLVGNSLDLDLILADSNNAVLESVFVHRQAYESRDSIMNLFRRSYGGVFICDDGTKVHVDACSISRKSGADIFLIVSNLVKPLSLNEIRQLQDAFQTFIGINGYNFDDYSHSGLIGAVIQGNRKSAQRIMRKMNIRQKDIDGLIVIEPNSNNHSHTPYELLRLVRQELTERFPDIISDIYHELLIVIGSSSLIRRITEDMLEAYIGKQEEDIMSNSFFFSYLQNVEQFQKCFGLVLSQKSNASYIYPNWHLLGEYHLKIAESCQKTAEAGEAEIRKCLSILSPLDEIEEPQKTELRKTLAVYLLDSYNSISKTAEIMYMHKNTIKYRINRINECVGFRVNEMPETIDCYLACALERYLSAEEVSKWTNSAYHNCF